MAYKQAHHNVFELHVTLNKGEEELNKRLIDIKQTIRKYQSSVIVEDEETLQSEEALYNEKFENCSAVNPS